MARPPNVADNVDVVAAAHINSIVAAIYRWEAPIEGNNQPVSYAGPIGCGTADTASAQIFSNSGGAGRPSLRLTDGVNASMVFDHPVAGMSRILTSGAEALHLTAGAVVINSNLGIRTTPGAVLDIQATADGADTLMIRAASNPGKLFAIKPESALDTADILYWMGAGFGTIHIRGPLKLTELPSTNPGAGSKKLWYDPAAGNAVKFAP